MTTRRSPLEKERWLEGNRQRWLGVGVAMWAVVLACHCWGALADPQPFLTSITALVGAFVLGASGTDAMKIYRYPAPEQHPAPAPRQPYRPDPTPPPRPDE
jgi:hypothetical protein